MKKKVFSVLLTVALATGVLAGCGSSAATGNNAATGAAQNEGSQTASATTAGEEPGDTIVIRSCFATGMTGAVNRFASADTNSTVMSLITRGEIDVADGDPSSYIPGIYNGVPAKLVGNMWRYSGCYWLVANNDIQDFSDLEGKKVGTAGASGGMRLSVLKMLEKNGVSTDNVDLIANGVYQTAYASLTSGEVDATIIHNPYAALAEADGTGHILGRAWDYIPDYYTGTIIASNSFIENEPEKLQRFLTAYYQVHEEVKNDYFDEFVAWAAKEMNTSEEVMRKAIESEIDVWIIR